MHSVLTYLTHHNTGPILHTGKPQTLDCCMFLKVKGLVTKVSLHICFHHSICYHTDKQITECKSEIYEWLVFNHCPNKQFLSIININISVLRQILLPCLNYQQCNLIGLFREFSILRKGYLRQRREGGLKCLGPSLPSINNTSQNNSLLYLSSSTTMNT